MRALLVQDHGWKRKLGGGHTAESGGARSFMLFFLVRFGSRIGEEGEVQGEGGEGGEECGERA